MYLEDTGKLRFTFNSHVGTSISTIPSNQWTHVAITFNSSGIGNLYLNGKFDIVIIMESLQLLAQIHYI